MTSPPPPPLRIAVLEADIPLDRILEKYGTYGDIFTRLLHQAADTIDLPRERLEISKWDVLRKMEYPDLEGGEVDAVLITGSRYNAFDSDPWILKLVAFTREILSRTRHDIRIIGVCYGHQIIGRALGGTVARHPNDAWEVSVCPVTLSPKGVELFRLHSGSANTTTSPSSTSQTLHIFQMHRDILLTLPPQVQPLGSSPTCAIQGMYIPNRLISVQGHPEFTEEIVRELLETRKTQGVFGQEVYGSGVERVGDRQDGVAVAVGFLRFLLEEDGGEE